MVDKFLLYIDLLGFSDLVVKKGRVEELYAIVDSLNVHEHGAFKVIVFSDTILVYNEFNGGDDAATVMWLCEFAQDLFYRLIKLDLHFRAYICRGEFTHRRLKNTEAFYGEALIRSYRREGQIQCSGLFIEKELAPLSTIFRTDEYDNTCHYVHIMQNLVRLGGETYPVHPMLIRDQGLEYLLAYDVVYLKRLHSHMRDTSLDPRARVKYASAWLMIEKRLPSLLKALEGSHFDPQAICAIDWTDAMNRVGTPQGFFG